MAFCSKFMAAIRKIMDQVGPKLDEIIEKITKVTKTVKDIIGSPAVEVLIKLIPHGSDVQKWLLVALNTVAGITATADDFHDKLKEWLDSLPSEEAKNAMLAKLASVAARAADTEDGTPAKREKVYDTAVLARIVADTPAANLVPVELAA